MTLAAASVAVSASSLLPPSSCAGRVPSAGGRIPSLDALRTPILEMTAALEKLALVMAALEKRLEREDAELAAFRGELTRLRDQLDLEQAKARLERERWRTERAEALGVTAVASGVQGTVKGVAGATLALTVDAVRIALESQVGTRPFTGGGLRWSMGDSGAQRIGGGRCWLRVAAEVAPIDTGAAVQDLALPPVGQDQPVTSHLALPLLQVGVGVVAIFP